ncbi:MAG: NAD-dependent epimerase/dehydratase family protein [Phycisphaerales bacterium]
MTAYTPDTSATPGGARRNAAVLITGASGEMGHGLIHALHSRGRRDILALDIREVDPELRPYCRESLVGDITDTALLERLLATYEIDAVFHLAALLSTRSEYAPEAAHHVNVNGTINLLRLANEQARSHGRSVAFIFPSSIAAYGMPSLETKQRAGRVREDQFNTPATMYGCNKLSCEHLGAYYAEHYRRLAKDRGPNRLDFRCIRFPGIISAFTLPSGGTSDYAPEMIHAAAQGQNYHCFVRPDARIPFMTMPDAIDALLALHDAPRERLSTHVYNISAFAPSAKEVLDIVERHFPGARSLVDFKIDHARQGIIDSWPEDIDDTLARRDWGYAPKHDLESAFRDYLVPNIKERYAHA